MAREIVLEGLGKDKSRAELQKLLYVIDNHHPTLHYSITEMVGQGLSGPTTKFEIRYRGDESMSWILHKSLAHYIPWSKTAISAELSSEHCGDVLRIKILDTPVTSDIETIIVEEARYWAKRI